MPQNPATTPPDNAVQFSAADFVVRSLFPTPFVVAPVFDHEALNPVLLKVIRRHAETSAGVMLSNAGGWQSTDDFQVWGGAAGAGLLEAGRRLADSLTVIATDQGLAPGAPLWRINAWANVNAAGDFNHPHHHPAAFWSGVYWVDDGGGEGGELELSDPRGVLPAFYAPRLRMTTEGGLTAGSQDFFTPKSGTMVLFPSWLVHAVRPYRGDRQRVSIAFNLSI